MDPGDLGERLLARRRRLDGVAACLQVRGEGPPHLDLVVDDEDDTLLAHPAITSSSASGSEDHRRPAARGVLEAEVGAGRLREAAGDGEAETDPRPADPVPSPRRWNGSKARSRSAVGMPGPRSTTGRRSRPALPRRRPDRHTVRRPRDGDVDESPAPARSARDRYGTEQRLGHLHAPVGADPVTEAGESGREQLVDADLGPLHVDCVGAIRLMSSRSDTRAVNRSVSASIDSRNSRTASGGPVDVVGEQLVVDALIDRERRAQEVAHGGEDGRPQLVRLPRSASASSAVAAMRRTSRTSPRRLAKAASTARSLASDQPRAGEHQHASP